MYEDSDGILWIGTGGGLNKFNRATESFIYFSEEDGLPNSPGLGKVGPACNFAFMVPLEKWVLVWLMLIGRLEIYTVLVLLMPGTWRKI